MLVIRNKEVEVPGVLESLSFKQNPKFAFTNPKHSALRTTTWPRNICLHTRMGLLPPKILSTTPNRRWDEIVAPRQSSNDTAVSWHVSIDADGTFVCHLDLVLARGFHAGQCNDVSIGIEMFQEADGTMYEATFDTCVKVCDAICIEMGIARAIPAPDERGILRRFANPKNSVLNRSIRLAHLPGGRAGEDFVGVWGHRNGTRNRGAGDPGDEIFKWLQEAGFKAFSLDADEDIAFWKDVQKRVLKWDPKYCDGIPGPMTVAALKDMGFSDGLYL